MKQPYLRRHDFVVVETIDFFREEENELPPPMALKEVVALNKAAPYEADEDEAEDGAQANGKPQDMQVRWVKAPHLWPHSASLSWACMHELALLLPDHGLRAPD